ncbi:hypothetical protein DFH01_08330 [Falsiroseomonas bella]|uniref:Lipoprotein n=1 Tax=Falsiroseomonas bella TaxID=2184016 RepID=A0A317FCQ6_9PROT|nr:hypothetical protein [Falsiroseomonas bella]PWS36890.1 hypothetical protein DFH01_08330 [Falsiroseomonas bella]
MRRHLFRLLLALPLAGCVIPTDPVRLAARGPSTNAQVTAAGRTLAEGERIVLVIRETQLDPDRLHRCIADGMRARLPASGPTVVALDPAGAARLSAAVPADLTAALPEELARFGVEWAVVVRDGSTRVATPESGLDGYGGGGGGVIGGYVGERVDYALSLEATILDLRERRRLGRATAWYAARGGGGIAAGIAGGGGGDVAIAVPFVLPIIRVPAGTSALAICNAFGRTIGDALVSATAQPAATEAGRDAPPS